MYGPFLTKINDYRQSLHPFNVMSIIRLSLPLKRFDVCRLKW